MTRARATARGAALVLVCSLSRAMADDPYLYEVREIHFEDQQVLRWTPYDDTDESYNIYLTDRTRLERYDYGACIASGIGATTWTIGDVPAPGGVYYYLVSRSALDREGTLGYDSHGLTRGTYEICNVPPVQLPEQPIVVAGYRQQIPAVFRETDLRGDMVRDVWDDITAHANVVIVDHAASSDPLLTPLRNRGVLACRRLATETCASPSDHADKWRNEAAGYRCVSVDEFNRINTSEAHQCGLSALERIRPDFQYILTWGAGFLLGGEPPYLERLAAVTDLHIQQNYGTECSSQDDGFEDAYATLGTISGLRRKSIFGLTIAQYAMHDHANDPNVDFLEYTGRRLSLLRSGGFSEMDRGVAFWVVYRARPETAAHAMRLSDWFITREQRTPYQRRTRSLENAGLDLANASGGPAAWTLAGADIQWRAYCAGGVCPRSCDRAFYDPLSPRPWFHYMITSDGADCGRFLGACAPEDENAPARYVRMVRGGGSADNELRQFIDVNPSTIYVLSAVVRSGNPAAPSAVSLVVTDDRGSSFMRAARVFRDIASETWSEVRIPFTTLPTTTRLRIGIRDDLAPEGAVTYVDFVELMTASDLHDSSYESDAAGWTLVDGDGSGPGTVGVVDVGDAGLPALPDGGLKALRLAKGPTEDFNQVYDDIDVEPVTPYRASCWIAGAAAATDPATVRLIARDVRANIVLNETTVGAGSPGAWSRITLDFRTPGSTDRLRFLLSDFRAPPGQAIHIDYCQLERLDLIPVAVSNGS